VLSFGFGVDFVEGRTSESGSGFGASVVNTSLLSLFSSGPTNETGRGGVKLSNFPSTVETSIAFSPLPCPSPAAMMEVVSGLRKYHAHAPSTATCITMESIASRVNQCFPVSVVKSGHPKWDRIQSVRGAKWEGRLKSVPPYFFGAGSVTRLT